jgi:hypothetical protein
MEPIFIESSHYHPLIEFHPNGRLLMEGRSIPEDVTKLFNPLLEFAKDLEQKEIIFDINLDYFNTATSKKLLELLKCIDNNHHVETFFVNWHYDADDEDSLEMGEIYEESLSKAEFSFREHKTSISLSKVQ